MFKIFKQVTFYLALVSLLVQILILLWIVFQIVDAWNLTGGGRAQAELVILPIVIYGGPVAIISLVLMLVNATTDIIRWQRKMSVYHRNLLLYVLLVVIILIPILSPFALLDLLYSGWNWPAD